MFNINLFNQYAKKYKLIKLTQKSFVGGIRLPDPGQYMIEASFGKEYYSLSNKYFDWGKELHNYGDTLDEEKLFKIYRYGLLEWYCRKLITSIIQKIITVNIPNNVLYDTTYNYKGNAKFFNGDVAKKPINCIKREDYNICKMFPYDIIKYLTLAKPVPKDMNMNMNIFDFLNANQATMFEIFDNIDKYVKPYEKINYLYGNVNNWTDILADLIVSNDMDINMDININKKIGIAFQRYKIVSEKIGEIINSIQVASISNYDNIQKLILYAQNIERMLNDLQVLIYYSVFNNEYNIEEIITKLFKDDNININFKDELKKINLSSQFLREPEYQYIITHIDQLVKSLEYITPKLLNILSNVPK